MPRMKAKNLYLGSDGDGFFFSFTDAATGVYQSVNLNPMQVVLILEQAAHLVCKSVRETKQGENDALSNILNNSRPSEPPAGKD